MTTPQTAQMVMAHLVYAAWWARIALVARTYRMGRALLALHAPSDPLCRRRQPAAHAHPRGHGLECAPCARDRSAHALWDQLERGQ